MSHCVVVAPAIWPVGTALAASVGLSVPLLLAAIHEVKGALHEIHELEGCKTKVDAVIETAQGEKIGVCVKAGRPVEFVVNNAKSKGLDQIKQAYARLKVLEEVKKKGYQKVTEEKLADGSIRMVVQRWQ